MLIVLDFGFMGGTMGCVVGEKVALALEQAVKGKLPAIAVVTSGGARIQEGILSLMQMAKTSVAQGKLEEKGLPFISVSGQHGHRPGLCQHRQPRRHHSGGARCHRRAVSHEAYRGVERAAAASRVSHRRVAPAARDDRCGRGQDAAPRPAGGPAGPAGPAVQAHPRGRRAKKRHVEAQRPEAWSSVQLARHESRPSSTDYIGRIFSSFVELHGDRSFGDDTAIASGLAHLGGQTVMVVGQERGRGSSGRTSPEGFRKAQRIFRLASKFDLPLITLIDTPGPDPSLEAEERGLGNTIATAMAQMARLQIPSISVVIGEGGSAGALALGVADRVLMMEHAIYSAISPEDAAGLIFQDRARADEAAESLRLTARDCLELGIVDVVVPEPPGGAHTNPEEAARQLRRILLQELAELQSMSKRKLLNNRYKKFRKMGEYSSHFRAAITREVNALRGLVTTGVKRLARRRRQEPEEWPEGLLAEAESATEPPASESGSSPS